MASAHYRLEVKTISRGKGQSTVAHAAYRSGEDIYFEKESKLKTARTQSEVSHKGILLPENAPAEFGDRARLWNAVEEKERRKNSRLAREVLVSIPREIEQDKHQELVWGFAKNEFVARGMIADISIHQTDARDGKPNPHAHIMLTTRECNEDGFTVKNRSWNDTALLVEWREAWADHVNLYLADSGSDARVDHRSLKDRGIVREPEPKIGHYAWSKEKRGIRTVEGDAARKVRHQNAWANSCQAWRPPGDPDWRDMNRSIGVEIAFNGMMSADVQARFEEMRQRVLEDREARRNPPAGNTMQLQQFMYQHARQVSQQTGPDDDLRRRPGGLRRG